VDAEVSADDVTVIMSTDDPMILVTDVEYDDSASEQPNGLLDPGEIAGLQVTFRNFGEPVADVQAQLSSYHPTLEVLSGDVMLPDLETGQEFVTVVEPFIVQATELASEGELVHGQLAMSWAGGQAGLDLGILVGQYDYLVWDPAPLHDSGPILNATLAGVGHVGEYCLELPDEERLERYRTLFICCGHYDVNHIITQTSTEGLTIQRYLADGGCVYLEGGDVFYYDSQQHGEGYDFSELFGIQGENDGFNLLTSVHGRPGTFTDGMAIPFVGHRFSIDQMSPIHGAYTVMSNPKPSFDCVIARDAGHYRTVGSSLAFGGLADLAPPSNKADYVRAIMDFFRDGTVTGLTGIPNLRLSISAYPNPFNPSTTIEFTNPRSQPVALEVYDVRGRRVHVLEDGMKSSGRHAVSWDGCDGSGARLGSGQYLVRLRAGAETRNYKLMLVK